MSSNLQWSLTVIIYKQLYIINLKSSLNMYCKTKDLDSIPFFSLLYCILCSLQGCFSALWKLIRGYYFRGAVVLSMYLIWNVIFVIFWIITLIFKLLVIIEIIYFIIAFYFKDIFLFGKFEGNSASWLILNPQ